MVDVKPVPGLETQRPKPTGRTLVLMHEGVDDQSIRNLLRDKAGVDSADVRDFSGSGLEFSAALEAGTAIVVPTFGVAIVPRRDGEGGSFKERMSASERVAEVRPEFFMYATSLRGPYSDNGAETWGVVATGADKSGYAGRGIKLAVLDTGFDLQHPDLPGARSSPDPSCRVRACRTSKATGPTAPARPRALLRRPSIRATA